jgi:hypothetical protein
VFKVIFESTLKSVVLVGSSVDEAIEWLDGRYPGASWVMEIE